MAVQLGRHYVAGLLDAPELDVRLECLFAEPNSAGDLLTDLPSLEPAAPAERSLTGCRPPSAS